MFQQLATKVESLTNQHSQDKSNELVLIQQLYKEKLTVYQTSVTQLQDSVHYLKSSNKKL